MSSLKEEARSLFNLLTPEEQTEELNQMKVHTKPKPSPVASGKNWYLDLVRSCLVKPVKRRVSTNGK